MPVERSDFLQKSEFSGEINSPLAALPLQQLFATPLWLTQLAHKCDPLNTFCNTYNGDARTIKTT